MAGALDRQEFRWSWDQRQRRLQFGNGTERVGGSVDENSRRAQIGKMRGPQLGRLARWVQRIGQQQQAFRELGFLGREHAGLPSSVRLAAEIDRARRHFAKKLDCRSQAGSVRGRQRWRRGTARTLLAKRKVATENGYTSLAECGGEGHQQRSVAISSGAMRQDNSARLAPPSDVEKSVDAALIDRNAIVQSCWHLRNRSPLSR